MDIFYIDSDNFQVSNLQSYAAKQFNSSKAMVQHCLGRFLVQNVAESFYKINSEIIVKNSKPCFKTEKICFSISHSNNIILAAFDKYPVGVDIEYMKPRNFKPILERFNVNIENPGIEDFYKFWTEYEAKYKLQTKAKSIFTTKFLKDFMLTVASSNPCNISEQLKIYELNTDRDLNYQSIIYKH